MENNELKNKKVHLKTYGCQMNEYDSEIIRAILLSAGFGMVETVADADVILLNTCAVRENAHRKIYGHVHALRHKLGERGRAVRFGILGCMATNLKSDLLDDRHLGIDFIAGPDSYRVLPDLIRQALDAKPRPQSCAVDLDGTETYADITPARVPGVNAWVAVTRGCNNFCTFCVVPYTRGRERSRSMSDILAEVQRLSADGYKQVTLLGQNVNSYRHDGADFADLLTAVSAVPGIARVRFTSPHPKDFLDRVIEVVADNPKVCPHIHLPLQAGHDRILQLMNRTYTQAQFLALVDRIRARCPGVALTTDVIVGFPTETAAEFDDTAAVMRRVRFDAAFIFKYSPRKGTVASRRYPDDVPEPEKTRRIVALNELQTAVSLDRNRAIIGQEREIMIEDLRAQRDPALCLGRTADNKQVVLPNQGYTLGQLITVPITDASPHVLRTGLTNI